MDLFDSIILIDCGQRNVIIRIDNRLSWLPNSCKLSKKVPSMTYGFSLDLYSIVGQKIAAQTPEELEEQRNFWQTRQTENVFFDTRKKFKKKNWQELMTCLSSHPNHPVRVSRKVWMYWRDVLPPEFMNLTIQVGETKYQCTYLTGEGPLYAGMCHKEGDKWIYQMMGTDDSTLIYPEGKSTPITVSGITAYKYA